MIFTTTNIYLLLSHKKNGLLWYINQSTRNIISFIMIAEVQADHVPKMHLMLRSQAKASRRASHFRHFRHREIDRHSISCRRHRPIVLMLRACRYRCCDAELRQPRLPLFRQPLAGGAVVLLAEGRMRHAVPVIAALPVRLGLLAFLHGLGPVTSGGKHQAR